MTIIYDLWILFVPLVDAVQTIKQSKQIYSKWTCTAGSKTFPTHESIFSLFSFFFFLYKVIISSMNNFSIWHGIFTFGRKLKQCWLELCFTILQKKIVKQPNWAHFLKLEASTFIILISLLSKLLFISFQKRLNEDANSNILIKIV